jgi:hypothetical protein
MSDPRIASQITSVTPSQATAPSSLPTGLMPKGCSPTHPVTFEELEQNSAPFFSKPRLPKQTLQDSLSHILYGTEEYQIESLKHHRVETASKSRQKEKVSKKRYEVGKSVVMPESPLPLWLKSASLLASSWGLSQTGASPLNLASTAMSLTSFIATAASESSQNRSKMIGMLALGASAIALGPTVFAGQSHALATAYTFFNAISGFGVISQAVFQGRKKSAEGEISLLDADLEKKTTDLTKTQSKNLKMIASSENAAVRIMFNWVKDKSDIQKGLWESMQA